MSHSEETKMNNKKKIRGGHKGHVTKMIHSIRGMTADYREKLEAELIAKKECLERKGELIRKLDEEILEGIEDDAEIVEEIEKAEDLQTEVQIEITKINKFLKEQRERMSTTVDNGRGVGHRHATTIGLPKLEIPKFSGNPREYQSFMECFDSAMNLYNMPDVQKFTYLRRYVTGAAEQSIKGLALTDANFREAKDVLKQRFGNKQVIVNCHMESLISLPTICSDIDTKGIRDLYDKIEVDLRSLKNLGIEPVMKSKLPHGLNLILSRKFDSATEVWKIDELMEALRVELEARERIQNSKVKSRFNSTANDRSTVDNLLVESGPICAYCSRKHYSDQCRTVTDIEARKKLLRSENRCYLCTRKGHLSNKCLSKRNCFKCKGKHHTSICLQTRAKNYEESLEKNGDYLEKKEATSEEKKKYEETGNYHVNTNQDTVISLQTASVILQNPSNMKNRDCRIVLDTGSHRSYIKRSFVEELGLKKIGKERLQVNTFGSNDAKQKMYKNMGVTLIGKNVNSCVKLEALEVEQICSKMVKQKVNLAKGWYKILKNITFADEGSGADEEEVGLLIGLDQYWEIVSGRTIKLSNEAVAIETIFGYVLSGPLNIRNHGKQCLNNFLIHSAEMKKDCVEDALHRFWSLESLGLKDKEINEEKIIQKIEFKNGRYSVSLPWKDDHPLLCDNFSLSEKRLYSQLIRLRKNPELLQRYHNIIEEQRNMGMVEVAPEEPPLVGRTYYMPHRAVIREDHSTTKIRVVFDASAKSSGVSLNDCLEGGDSKFTDLLGNLLKFRVYTIGFVADMEKAFLSIAINDKDRDALRFLWVKNPFEIDMEIITLRHTRACFGLISSIFHLQAVINYHIDTFLEKCGDDEKNIAISIRNSLYVDDLATGVNDVKDGKSLYETGKTLFNEAGMNLRKWKSNSTELMEYFDEMENIGSDLKNKGNENECNQADVMEVYQNKVLGIPWNLKEDEFIVDISDLIEGIDTSTITKRDFLKFTASIFDPFRCYCTSFISSEADISTIV